MASPIMKKILIAVIVLGALGAAWYYFYGNSEIDLSVMDLSDTSVVGQNILILTEKLKYIEIDPAIFSGALLANLRDFRVPLTSEVQGRPNPFAPFGVDVGVVPHRAAPISTQTPTSTTTTGL